MSALAWARAVSAACWRHHLRSLLTPVFFYIIDNPDDRPRVRLRPDLRRIGGIVLGILTLGYLWRPRDGGPRRDFGGRVGEPAAEAMPRHSNS